MHAGNNCIGPLILIFYVPIVTIPIWIAYAVVRPSPKAPITPPTPLTRWVAEEVARRLHLWYRAVCTVGFVLTATTLVSDMPGWSILLVIGSVLALRRVCDCRTLLHRLEHLDAIAERRDDWLVVRSCSGESGVCANRRLFRAAIRVGLPTASIARAQP
jgi:hypothetical protein